MKKQITIALTILLIIILAIGTYFYLKNSGLKETYSSIIGFNEQGNIKTIDDLILNRPYPEIGVGNEDYQQFECEMRTKFNKENNICGTIVGISQLAQDSNSPQQFVNF